MAGAGTAGAAIGFAIPTWLMQRGSDLPPDSGLELTSYPRTRIARLSELQEGVPLDFEYPLEGQSSFVVKLGKSARSGVGPQGDVVAFSYFCTHMGCPLKGFYDRNHAVIGPCPCHFSTFDLRQLGQVVRGQATEELPQIILEVEGDDVYALGVVRLIYGFRNNLRDARPAGAVG